MNVVTGPLHPALEDALIRTILAHGGSSVPAPLVVLVPSEGIRRRVAWRLAREERAVLLNVHLLTFHQLARRVVVEGGGPVDRALVDDAAFEELVRHLVAAQAGTSFWSRVHHTPGGCAALWQTLRDLKDARVDPDALGDGIDAGLFGPEAAPRLRALGTLYRDVLAAAHAAGWTDYTDLDVAAVDLVPHSRFLAAASGILHYGFYDLTQAQYDVCAAVARHYETTVFFPVVGGHPMWEFAERFYRRFVTGLGDGRRDRLDGADPVLARLFIEAPTEPPPGASPAVRIECSGARDEVTTTAKLILRLVEDEGVAWHDIAVVARGMEAYGEAIALEFPRHGIPMARPPARRLAAYPLTHAVVAASHAVAGVLSDLEAEDLLRSPYWRGREADRAALVASASTVLSERASGAEHATHFRAWLETVIGLEEHAASREMGAVALAILAAIEHPAHLDPIRRGLSREEFLAAVLRRFDAGRVPGDDGSGVHVLDAMAARGLSIRALFVLGMNEGVFPRIIREDAFLRDAERRVLETALGYKIPEKLAGYDEERLLFGLLAAAARERICFLVQRADEAGRPLVPSWYLDEWSRAVHGAAPAPPAVVIPRRTRAKARVAPYTRYDHLTPREAAIRLALHHADPSLVFDPPRSILAARGRDHRAILNARGPLTAWDGRLGASPERAANRRARGYSASLLQRYARCPMQMWLAELTGDAARSCDAEAGPDAAAWGRLGHEALAIVYGQWAVDPPASPSDAGARARDACRAVFDRFAQSEPVGYPLLWEVVSTRLTALISAAVAEDARAAATSGARPVAAEVTLRGTLRRPDAPIHGRLDRVDRYPDGHLRVIDFKIGRGGMTIADPVRSALRGANLQGPLYAALAESYAAANGTASPGGIEVALAVIGDGEDGPLTIAPYAPDAATAERVADGLAFLIDGLESGWHAMMPDRDCSWCEVASACRRRDPPVRARAAADERARRHAAFRRTRATPP